MTIGVTKQNTNPGNQMHLSHQKTVNSLIISREKNAGIDSKLWVFQTAV